MGCWDVYCSLCGISCGGFLADINELKNTISNREFTKILKKIKWIERCTILLPNKKALHGFKEVNGNIKFCNNKKKICYNIDNPLDGIVLHTDC